MWSETQVESIVSTVPEWLAVILSLGSHLGSVRFVVPAVVLLYWTRASHRTAAWPGIVGGGYGVMITIKSIFNVPRPSVAPPAPPDAFPVLIQTIYTPAVEIGTTSFPSGHAIIATVVWGLFVTEFDLGTRRQRAIIGVTVVSLVALSRVGLGVHFPIDVVVGIAIGGIYLICARALVSRATAQTTTALGIGCTILPLAVIVSGGGWPVLLLGGLLGSLVGWVFVVQAVVTTAHWEYDRILVGVSIALTVLVLPSLEAMEVGRLTIAVLAGIAVMSKPLLAGTREQVRMALAQSSETAA